MSCTNTSAKSSCRFWKHSKPSSKKVNVVAIAIQKLTNLGRRFIRKSTVTTTTTVTSTTVTTTTVTTTTTPLITNTSLITTPLVPTPSESGPIYGPGSSSTVSQPNPVNVVCTLTSSLKPIGSPKTKKSVTFGDSTTLFFNKHASASTVLIYPTSPVVKSLLENEDGMVGGSSSSCDSRNPSAPSSSSGSKASESSDSLSLKSDLIFTTSDGFFDFAHYPFDYAEPTTSGNSVASASKQSSTHLMHYRSMQSCSFYSSERFGAKQPEATELPVEAHLPVETDLPELEADLGCSSEEELEQIEQDEGMAVNCLPISELQDDPKDFVVDFGVTAGTDVFSSCSSVSESKSDDHLFESPCHVESSTTSLSPLLDGLNGALTSLTLAKDEVEQKQQELAQLELELQQNQFDQQLQRQQQQQLHQLQQFEQLELQFEQHEFEQQLQKQQQHYQQQLEQFEQLELKFEQQDPQTIDFKSDPVCSQTEQISQLEVTTPPQTLYCAVGLSNESSRSLATEDEKEDKVEEQEQEQEQALPENTCQEEAQVDYYQSNFLKHQQRQQQEEKQHQNHQEEEHPQNKLQECPQQQLQDHHQQLEQQGHQEASPQLDLQQYQQQQPDSQQLEQRKDEYPQHPQSVNLGTDPFYSQPDPFTSMSYRKLSSKLIRKLYPDLTRAKQLRETIGSANALKNWILKGTTIMPEINGSLFICIEKNGLILEKLWLKDAVDEKYDATVESMLHMIVAAVKWYRSIMRMLVLNGYTKEIIEQRNYMIRSSPLNHQTPSPDAQTFSRPPCRPLIIVDKRLKRVKNMRT